MAEGKSSPSLDALDAKIRKARADSQRPGRGKNAIGDGEAANKQGMAFAFRLGSELVASLVVGVGIGFGLDYWLETKPVFLIIFFLLGAGSGISSVYRAASGIDISVGYQTMKEADKTKPEELRKDQQTLANKD